MDNARLYYGAVLFLSAIHAARANDFDRAEALSDMAARGWPENAEASMLRFLLEREDDTAQLITEVLAELRVSEEATPYLLAMADAIERIPISGDALQEFTQHEQNFLRFLQEVARSIDDDMAEPPSEEVEMAVPSLEP